jgi:mono/diheme cytochrome c family protein
MPRRIVQLAVLVGALAVLGAGCGGGGSESSPPTEATTTATDTMGGTTTGGAATGDAANGAKVFASAGCGGCHTFSKANSSGSVGPNLDDLGPSFDTVVHQVTNGGGAMPAFKDQLSEQEIRDVAAFVSGQSS